MNQKTITRFRGDTNAIEVTVEDSSGDAVDITGYSFTLSVSASSEPDGLTPLFSVSGSIASAVAGTVTFTPSAANTDHVGSYWYDIQMTDAGGLITTILEGPFILKQDVTQ